VVQKLATKVGLGSEREEIIEFTRAALAIEAERNDGMEFYASLMDGTRWPDRGWTHHESDYA
jgi:hypothetical protein